MVMVEEIGRVARQDRVHDAADCASACTTIMAVKVAKVRGSQNGAGKGFYTIEVRNW